VFVVVVVAKAAAKEPQSDQEASEENKGQTLLATLALKSVGRDGARRAQLDAGLHSHAPPPVLQSAVLAVRGGRTHHRKAS
jgi:hypothetical protein